MQTVPGAGKGSCPLREAGRAQELQDETLIRMPASDQWGAVYAQKSVSGKGRQDSGVGRGGSREEAGATDGETEDTATRSHPGRCLDPGLNKNCTSSDTVGNWAQVDIGRYRRITVHLVVSG